MSEPVRVKDVFSCPSNIRKGDFVVKLAEGIDDPKATAATYKVTPDLADTFDRALRLVDMFPAKHVTRRNRAAP